MADVWRLASGKDFQALHVWPRDLHAPGEHDFEVGLNETSRAVEAALRLAAPPEFASLQSPRPTESGQLVLDVVVLPIADRLRDALRVFGSQMRGYLSDDAVLDRKSVV